MLFSLLAGHPTAIVEKRADDWRPWPERRTAIRGRNPLCVYLLNNKTIMSSKSN